MPCPPNLRLDPGSLKGRGADILLPGRGSPFGEAETPVPADLAAAWTEPPAVPEAVVPPAVEPPLAPIIEVVLPTPTLADPGLPAWLVADAAALRAAQASAAAALLSAVAKEPPPADSPAEAALSDETPLPSGLAPPALAAAPAAASESFSDGELELGNPQTQAAIQHLAEVEGTINWDAARLPPAMPDPFPPIERETFALSGPLPRPRRVAHAQAEPARLPEPSTPAANPAPSAPPAPSPLPVPQPQPSAPTAEATLVQCLVDDAALKTVWQHIDNLEVAVTTLTGVGSALKSQALQRLMAARTRLMSSRSYYEEARHEVMEIQALVTRLQQTSGLARPLAVGIYLVGLTVLVAGGLWLSFQINLVQLLAVLPTANDWLRTLLFGLLGGLTAAFFYLMQHPTDYDPQHARALYLSPLLGLLFGPVVVLLCQLGLPLLFATAPSALVFNPWAMYLLAWLVGFQHTFFFRFLNGAWQNVLPNKAGKPTA